MDRRDLLKMAAWVPFVGSISRLEFSAAQDHGQPAESDDEDSSDSFSLASSCSCSGACLGGLASCGGLVNCGVEQDVLDAYWEEFASIRTALGEQMTAAQAKAKYAQRWAKVPGNDRFNWT